MVGNIVMSLGFTGPFAFMGDNSLGEMQLMNPITKETDTLSIPHFGFSGDRQKCIEEATARINVFFDSMRDDIAAEEILKLT